MLCTVQTMQECCEQIHLLYRSGVSDVAELAAGIAAKVASIPIGLDAPLARLVTSEAGVLTASCVLERFSYSIDGACHLDLVHHLALENTASTQLAYKFRTGIKRSEPRPRIIVLTPLSNVKNCDHEHQELVEVARRVRAVLEPEGFVVDCPGERLHPETSHDWRSERMYDAEHRRILGAGLVVLAAADFPSWGLGQSQAWAEANIALVVQFAESTGRVLRAGNQYGTASELWDSPESVATRVIELARENRKRLVEHDCQGTSGSAHGRT